MDSSRKKESRKTGTVTERYSDKELKNIGKTWGDAERDKRTVFGGKLWWKPYTSRGAAKIKKLSRVTVDQSRFMLSLG